MEPIKKGDIFEYVCGDKDVCYLAGVGSIGVVAEDYNGDNISINVKWIAPIGAWDEAKHAGGSRIFHRNIRILKPEEISHAQRE